MKQHRDGQVQIEVSKVSEFLKLEWCAINRQVLSWTLCLACLLSGSVLLAQQETTGARQPVTGSRHRSIPALSFAYFQGTAQYLDSQGLIEGASSSPSLTGIASVSLAGGSVVTDFMVCGRDFASDQEFAGSLYRKSTMTTDSAFKVPQLMAHVNSGISFFSDKMVCLKAPVSSNVATIANLNWTYYVELTVGDTTEVIDAKVGYNCPTGTATC